MSRPKTIRIRVAELKIWRQLVDELSEYPMFREADFDCIQIVTKEKTPIPIIKDVEKPIIRLERFIQNNGNRKVGKMKLCLIMKISRPTLNKWLACGFLSEGNQKECSSLQYFDLAKVASKLRNQRNITNSTTKAGDRRKPIPVATGTVSN
jgi:hypothetical protein